MVLLRRMVGTTAFAARLVTSASVIAGAVTFLVLWGPRATPAYADIYGPLVAASGFLPPPPAAAGPLRHGTTSVNGQTFQYVIGHSRLRVDDVLTHFEQQFRSTIAGRSVSTAGRIDIAGGGAVSGVSLGDLEPPFDVAARVGRFVQTRRLSDLGRFHVVAAYAQQGTVFIEFTPANDVRIDRLFPAPGVDAPGDDLPGVLRPSGLQRVMTIDQGGSADGSRTIVYRAQDSRAAFAEFRTALAVAGWIANPQLDSSGVAHYTNGHQECFVAGTSAGEYAAVVLVYRQLQAKKAS